VRIGVVVALCLLAAGVAQAALSPPVIREPWTRQRCPAHPQSTVEIESCLERSVLASDQRINAHVAIIFRLIATSADRTTFVQGERAWLRYRRSSCRATASKFRGGSAEPIAYLDCEKSRNARHLADLADSERVLRQH
jgi:uncharacterized protein YecT (DUF1311 family)